ncbi:MAG: ATP-binding protein [Planctomycetota bacterium]|nr:ATP-binding protein [Planctomycetota bacterium]
MSSKDGAANNVGIVSTIPERCKRCYTCVRDCPAKAIKVEGGQARVMPERCIACGNCVKVCAQQAKLIQEDTDRVFSMLSSGEKVFACLAPSFPAAFDGFSPGQLVAAVRRLGFAGIWEVAFGAELVSRAYAKLFESARPSGRRLIATPCPAITAFVEMHMPELGGCLAPIVSPMVATARAIRRRHGPDVRTVFIGPCVAKKNELKDPALEGELDAAITFAELMRMFQRAGISPPSLPDEDPDGPSAWLGKAFAISGGLLKNAGLSADILANDVLVAEGKDRILAVLDALVERQSAASFFDLLFCEGCINGPKMPGRLSLFARKEKLVEFIRRRMESVSPEQAGQDLKEFEDLDLSRKFLRKPVKLRMPAEEEIASALKTMKKFRFEDQLNCGACGYQTCREKAVAVCQGLAEASMCLPYLVEELEQACRNLEASHRELAATQDRLIQTERLASMGQLSAGIAHEINNPLGTILLYSHMLIKQIRDDEAKKSDLMTIASEAKRCKDIVRGLLDFARQSRISKSPTEVRGVLDEVAKIVETKAGVAGVRVRMEVEDGMPQVLLDGAQIRQALVNLVDNAIDACAAKRGEVLVSARMSRGGGALEIRVSDNGTGIPKKHLSKLFTPFFTTKEMGKGTGLGLAIVYGIVKMHSGDISVESEEGRGTTFILSLPAGDSALSGAVPGPPPRAGAIRSSGDKGGRGDG